MKTPSVADEKEADSSLFFVCRGGKFKILVASFRKKTYICENKRTNQMKRIFLIGYMGAGKTTVGKDLAKKTGLSFVDLDNHIEARYHKTVGQLFKEKGEAEFREIEKRMLHEVAMFEDILISTGGGAPCHFDNIQFMNSSGTTIYLKVSVGELVKRLEACKQVRPVLKGRTGEELKAFVAESLEQREPYYNQATFVYDAEVMLTEADVKSIVDDLHQWIMDN